MHTTLPEIVSNWAFQRSGPSGRYLIFFQDLTFCFHNQTGVWSRGSAILQEQWAHGRQLGSLYLKFCEAAAVAVWMMTVWLRVAHSVHSQQERGACVCVCVRVFDVCVCVCWCFVRVRASAEVRCRPPFFETPHGALLLVTLDKPTLFFQLN